MPAYATTDQLREYLDKLPTNVPNSRLQAVLDRARGIVDLVLGCSFLDAGEEWPAPAARTVRGEASRWLRLPAYQPGSITAIAAGDVAIDGWEEDAGAGLGVLFRAGGWADASYTVTAQWGHGPAPDAVVEVNLELAVNLWQAKAAGRFSDVVGVEGGGAVGYAKALTGQQKLVLEAVRARYRDAWL